MAGGTYGSGSYGGASTNGGGGGGGGPAGVEQIILDGLPLNDGAPWTILKDPPFTFTQAKKKLTWAGSALSDGSAAVGEDRYENAELSFMVTMATQADEDTALGLIHQLTQKLQKAQRVRGGIPLVWIPSDSSSPLTFYCTVGEHDEFPTSRESGWFTKEMSSQVHLHLRPFGHGSEEQMPLGYSEPWLWDSINGGRWRFDTPVPPAAPTVAVGTGADAGLLTVSSTVEKRGYLPWTTSDATITMKVFFGATLSSGNWSAMARRISATEFLRVGATGDGFLRIAKQDGGGAAVTLDQTAYAITASTWYWIVGSFVGDDITASLYAGADDGLTSPLATASYVLTSAEAKFSEGMRGNVGFRVNPASTDWLMDHFMVRGMPDIRTAEPSVSVEIPNIRGHVDAEARQEIVEDSAKARSSYEWGLECENYDPTVAWPHFLDSDVLDTTNMSGSQSSLTTGYDPLGVGAQAILSTGLSSTKGVVVCATGNQYHLGTFKVKARVSGTVGVRLRFARRKGSGPWAPNPWSDPLPDIAWHEVDMGTITIERSEVGLESWVGRIEALSPELENGTLLVDYLFFIPIGSGWGHARAPLQPIVPDTFAAVDHFNQGGGPSMTNKVLGSGGKWLTSGATVDANHPDLALHSVADPPEHWAERNHPSGQVDANLYTGRYATVVTNPAGAAITYEAIQAQCDLRTLVPLPKGNRWDDQIRMGIFVRASGTAAADGLNYFMLTLQSYSTQTSSQGTYAHTWRMKIYKRVVGQAGGLPQLLSTWGIGGHGTEDKLTLAVVVGATGVWEAYWWPAGTRQPTKPQRSGQDLDLATGGPLASGRIGIYDAAIKPDLSRTRVFDNFLAFSPTQDVVMHPGKGLTVRSDRTERESAAGGQWGKVPRYPGERFFLPPAGDQRRVARLFSKARQTDVDGGVADVTVTDAHILSVYGTPRYLHPAGGN